MPRVAGCRSRANARRSATIIAAWPPRRTSSSSSRRSNACAATLANPSQMSWATSTSWPSADRIERRPSRACTSRPTTRIRRDIRSSSQQPACRARLRSAARAKYSKNRGDGNQRREGNDATCRTYRQFLLRRCGEVVGERARLAREVRGPRVVALAQGRLSLVEDVLGVLERFLLRRLQRSTLELRDAPGCIADVLPRPFREPLLLRGRQLGTERGLRPALGPLLRRRRAWGGRRRRVRGALENHLRVDAAAAAQGDQGGGQKHSWRHGEERPDDTGSVIVITVPRPTTESTSIRPSCIWTIR